MVITRWTSQAGRRRSALEPGYAKLDERTLPDLLGESARFARHVRYVGLDDTADGDWSDFFRADIAMVLALMSTFEPAAKSAGFRHLRSDVRAQTAEPEKLARFQQFIDSILALAHEVDGWLMTVEGLEPTTTTSAVRRLISSTIRHELAPLLESLRAYCAGACHEAALAQPMHCHCHHFHAAWRITDICPDSSIYRGHSRRRRIDAALDALDGLADTFVNAVSDLCGRAKGEFDACLREPNHKPHIALLMAVTRLLAAAQERINDVPGRIIEFYYREVLREPLRRAVADRMFLSFTLAPRPDIGEAVVARGTRFLAGADASGRPILFSADRSVAVTSAQLARVRLLRTVRGAAYQCETRSAGRGDCLQRIVSIEMAVGPDGVAAGAPPQGWPMFGRADAGAEMLSAAPAPLLGFVIASRSLLLTGGDRSVSIAVRARSEAGPTKLAPLMQRLAAATGAAETGLARLLREAFSLALTTQQGWQAIPSFDVTVIANADDWTISLRFHLPPTFPAVVALDPLRARQPTDPSPDPQLPALMAQISQDPIAVSGESGSVMVYPLSLLESLSVQSVRVEAKVQDLPGLRVMTSAGAVETAGPFAPFGALARPEAWFDIRHPELFTKTLQQTTVTIQWLALPSHPNGFAGHYEQYLIGTNREPLNRPIDNQTFLATVALSQDGPWKLPAKYDKSLFLFRTQAKNTGTSDVDAPPRMDEQQTAPSSLGQLLPTSRFVFEGLQPGENGAPGSLTPALRVTLKAPSFGFADELYAPNVLIAVQPTPPPVASRRKCLLCKLLSLIGLFRDAPEPLPSADIAYAYPNPPWQPQIAAVTVDYQAADSTERSEIQFVHLLPSGALVSPRSEERMMLLPSGVTLTHLDLGFSALDAVQPLTLLFRMADDFERAGSTNAASRVTWHYQDAEQWVDLPQNALREDGTNGLSNSGVVSFDLPALSPDTSVERLSWLRIVPGSDPDAFPHVIAITPHALSATRVLEGATESLTPIPAKTVKSATPALRGVAVIDQPLASFGGEIAESAAELPIRLGERLRHKERASLDWDYAHLVLERFAEIAKVRMLAPRPRRARSGEVLIVVIPAAVRGPEKLMPSVGVGTRARIRASLQTLASPFARIDVLDPVYVCITARVRVMFRYALDDNASVRLNDDLCNFLSPSSDGIDLPDDAGSAEIRAAVAEFIQSRPYVASMVSLDLSFTPDLEQMDWCVPTSAERHDITAVIGTDEPLSCVRPADEESEYV